MESCGGFSTPFQEQTGAYMKLQAEFDNYEWYEGDEVEGEYAERMEGLREIYRSVI